VQRFLLVVGVVCGHQLPVPIVSSHRAVHVKSSVLVDGIFLLRHPGMFQPRTIWSNPGDLWKRISLDVTGDREGGTNVDGVLWLLAAYDGQRDAHF
jgi:hypothetical protein